MLLRETAAVYTKHTNTLWGGNSGCGCVGHGRGIYVNTSALSANIFFGIWEWNESNEMDTWLLL